MTVEALGPAACDPGGVGAGGHPLALAPHVHAVAVDDDMVFLDVLRDAYFCLPGARRVLDLSLDRRALAVQDRALVAEFAAAGFLSAEPDAQRHAPWSEPPAPRASAVEDAYERPTKADIPAAAGTLYDLLGAYRGRSFRQLLGAVERPAAMAPPAISPDLLREVHAFHRWIPYAPVSGKCLLRSFMLLRRLRRRGLDALWVFGVRTWPFHAHCWLQCEDLVLDDQFDRVHAFTPILVA